MPHRGCVDVHREHDDSSTSIDGEDVLEGRDPVDMGHGHVHQDQIGFVLSGESNCMRTVGCFSDDGMAHVAKVASEQLAEEAVVVGDHDASWV